MKNLLLAVLGGVVIGMLIAPDKGSATRKKLFGRLEDLSDDLSNRANDLYADGKSAVNTGVSRTKDLAKDVAKEL